MAELELSSIFFVYNRHAKHMTRTSLKSIIIIIMYYYNLSVYYIFLFLMHYI